MNEERQAWERQDGETQKAYSAFCVYRDMGTARSLLKAYRQQAGKAGATSVSGRWTEWSDVHNWLRRAEYYDAYLERQARANKEAEYHAELEKFRETQKKLAQ